MNPSESARLAADIGGTFTDVVLESRGTRVSAKVLTTPRAPEQGLLQGVAEVLQRARLGWGDVGVLVHGTTLATNALIERKGARTALITTAGFRDVLEMGYEKRYEHYDLNLELPPPLVPRALRLPVAERLTADGQVRVALQREAVAALVPVLSEAAVEAVAIGFLHSYADDRHERQAGAWLAELMPDVSITLSSAVCPELREYERFSTACANAYVQPLMASYLKRLEASLREFGFAGALYLMTSGGGLTTLETAQRFPVRLVESGPAGGAILACALAQENALDEVLSFDMGGTTAKICYVSGGRAEASRQFEVARVWRNLKGSGLPVRIPVTEMVEIGAGGGSIARLDAMARLQVGPASAGSEPGPACYGRGGTKPTVTDANLALGRIDPQAFAGGSLPLDRGAAEAALARELPGLALDVPWAAAGVCEIVEENMASAARVHAIERGKAAEHGTMIAFGGAAPLHAASLAAKLGMRRVLVPRDASVGSAVGFLRAPVAFEVVKSAHQRDDRFDAAAVNALLAAMHAEADAIVAAGALGAARAVRRSVEMRYLGQGHEIAIALPARELHSDDATALRAAYEQRYEAQFGLRISDVAVEFLTWSVVVSAGGGEAPRAESVAARAAPPPIATREVFQPQPGAFAAIPCWRREVLEPGMALAGPALVIEAQTTTAVPAGWQCRVSGGGHLMLERHEETHA